MNREQAIEELRSTGLRITAPRVAVLTALSRMPHSPAEVITEEARQSLGSVSTQAVYDILRAFIEVGLARRIEPAGHPSLFETRTGDNHHHVVCRSCGSIRDVDCAVGTRPCLDASEQHGYEIDEAEVTYWGTCPDCQPK